MSATSFLQRTFMLAKKAINPAPNPHVGAVIVKNGVIVGAGWHSRAGWPHAEIIALEQAGRKVEGATLYVTLEPCNHFGRTPPCAPAILKAGIKKVVIGMRDPNPLVKDGAKFLRQHGVKVTFLKNRLIQNACRDLNQIWLKNLKTKLPYVTLKLALTPEGSSIPPAGKKWISSAASRRRVQIIRAGYDAILVGVKTILADDPRLTVRSVKRVRQPVRIILDPHGRIPRSARIFREPGKTVIVTRHPKKFPNAENLAVRDFELKIILKKLYARGITSILIEGGITTAQHFLKTKFIDKIQIFYAPPAPSKARLFGKILALKDQTKTKIGPDVLLVGYLKKY